MRFTIWNTSADPREFFAVAEEAERSGWTSMCLNEGLFQPAETRGVYPYSPDGKRFWTPDTPYLDQMTILTAIAARTERLRLFPFVHKITLRNPLILSKAIATLALMTGDRIGVGVGMSWMPEEYELAGVDWDTRHQRYVESVEVLRLALTGEMFEYHGDVFEIPPVQSAPGAPKRVPIYLAGHKERSLRLAAKHGDGWCGVPMPADEIERCVRRLHELLAEEGRSPEDFEIHAGVIGAASVEDFERMREIGVTDAIVMPWMQAVADSANELLVMDTARKVAMTRQFGEEVIAQLGGVVSQA